MPIEVLLVQLLVLVFTGVLWWIARRDLAARVPPPASPAAPGQAADTAELEQLCATLETLVTSLAQRLDAVEAAQTVSQSSGPAVPDPVALPGPAAPEPIGQPDPHYAPVYALLEAGISDPVEIARQTKLSRGEVDLILSLRGRRAL